MHSYNVWHRKASGTLNWLFMCRIAPPERFFDPDSPTEVVGFHVGKHIPLSRATSQCEFDDSIRAPLAFDFGKQDAAKDFVGSANGTTVYIKGAPLRVRARRAGPQEGNRA